MKGSILGRFRGAVGTAVDFDGPAASGPLADLEEGPPPAGEADAAARASDILEERRVAGITRGGMRMSNSVYWLVTMACAVWT